jgi:hypothetical protein
VQPGATVEALRAAELSVLMSVAHAKALAGALLRAVLDHEKQFSIAKIPEEQAATLKKALADANATWK